MGGPKFVCCFYGAYMWYEKRVDISKSTPKPTFSLCCKQDMIKLPPPKSTPPFLDNLLHYQGGSRSSKFRENIRTYNSLFQFTSLGGKIDTSINSRVGPYIFRFNGQNYHRIGSLLPISGNKPRFAQLYIYGTENEINNRLSALNHDHDKFNVDAQFCPG